jgi:hypothetical protein
MPCAAPDRPLALLEATTTISLAGPGATLVTVWRMMSRNLAACRIVARPTTAMAAGSSVKVIRKA